MYCVYVCDSPHITRAYVWWSEDNFWKTGFSFLIDHTGSNVGPQGWLPETV